MTLHRLIVAPLALAAIFVLVYVADKHRTDGVAYMALTGIGLLGALWGGRLASDSVLSEIHNKTWDSQRMSALSPWTLTWGKLFGSTLFVWYCAVFCAAAYGMAMLTGDFSKIKEPEMLLALVLVSSFLAQAVALFSSLVSVRKGGSFMLAQEKTAYTLLGALTAFAVISFGYADVNWKMHWYSYELRVIEFTFISAVIFSAWAVIGSYRVMAEELQVKNTFFVWFIFNLFIVVYVFGIAVGAMPLLEQDIITKSFIAAFAVLGVIFYAALFSERKNPVAFRSMGKALKAVDLDGLFTLVPCWMVTFCLIAALVIVHSVVMGGEKAFLFFSGLFFALRDTFIVLYLNFSKNPKRADAAAVVYLLLIAFVLPLILYTAGIEEARAFFWAADSPYALAAGVLEAAAAFVLLKVRWRKNYGSVAAPIEQEG